jgi:hypothetical protein
MVNTRHGSVFGFTVDSDIPFNFLRAGGGEHVLHVCRESNPTLEQEGAPLYQWRLRDQTGDVTARLYHSEGIYHFWTADTGWYRINPAARTITILQDGEDVRRELRLWSIPTMLCFVELGCIPLHASAVEIDGGAVLFAAPGRFGKTTLALAFHQRGYRVLSEDLSCCRLTTDPVLLPGPAALRLRSDTFDGQAPEGTKLVSVKPDRIFLALDPARSGDCNPVLIRAIIFLRESDKNIHLEPVEKARALTDLWSLSFRVKGHAALARSFSGLSQLAASVSLWNLYRPLRMEVLGDVVSRIVEACAVTPE